ncbi:HSF-type DNA-binding domain protein [Blumeria hordei DH14]|uniref:HSF-type DNA-binding domain protein n=1 Tax=Blumeria graminis f. sp. hordei (strain DH14) TaxID=546991 RepID=N1JED1_BLUG1|nr:HSF-type DNA-binding domain protein [Blumeria hordei DH14]
MDLTDNRAPKNHFLPKVEHSPSSSRTIPILQAPNRHTSAHSSDERMEVVTPKQNIMRAPPVRMSPENETNGVHDQISMGEHSHNNSAPGLNALAVTSGQQPKVVQTAFIHKLYNMLEDQSIQHLISWSNSAESFVMSPSNDFSKVLSQYFKHTNISSFVRQLNMYGFHKVSDVFHTGSPESPLWEFKHGNGNFKRGDLVGLREIKRRASRHALVHRDSYSGPKPPPPPPGVSTDTMHTHQLQAHESTESRLTNLENTTYEMHAIIHKNEENLNVMHARNQAIMEALSRSLQLNHEMSRVVLSMIPNSDIPIHRDAVNMQTEIQRQIEIIRSLDEITEPHFANNRPFSNQALDNGPVSPRQTPPDDPRRGPTMSVARNSHHRPPLPSHIFPSPRRFSPMGTNTTQLSPNSLRMQTSPYQPSHQPPHPLTNSTPPTNLPRRHTSADIRNPHGWQTHSSSYGVGQSSTNWSSPKPGQANLNEEQQIQDSFNSYSLASASQLRPENICPTTPPPNFNNSSNDVTNNWAVSGREKPGCLLKEPSGLPTRRGSMAHILNPTTTTERIKEDEEPIREDDRKRKRIQ